jgi:hypothetical protein
VGRGVSAEGTPRLHFSRQALLVAPVRLALGGAALAAAVAIDLSFARAGAEAAVGAALIVFALISPGRRTRPERLRLPPPANSDGRSGWRILAEAMFPSTYVVAGLTAISLAFNRDLAAFLAGVLLGMGIAPLVALAAAR